MKFSAIISDRRNIKDPWYDIVYEWEDEIASHLGAKLIHNLGWGIKKSLYLRAIRYFGRIWKLRPTFAYQMQAWQWEGKNRANLYPCVIDFFLRTEEELNKFYANFSRNPIVFISSREAYEYLLAKNCPLKIKHLALSLPDKYAILPSTRFEKKYDLVVLGRQSSTLMSYLERYALDHPDFTYVKRVFLADETNGAHYARYVTNKGEELGYSDTREQYFNLMRSSRICFYSTPGVDKDRSDANAFNQVTPRFLEMIACGCHVLARYPKNPDTDWYDMESVAPSIGSYEQFEKAMDYARSHEVDMVKYSDYLAKHYTSVRAAQLERIVEEL